MKIQDLIGIFNESLNTEGNLEISEITTFKDLETWSSLSAFELVEKVYNVFHIKLRGIEIRRCSTVADLFELLMTKKHDS